MVPLIRPISEPASSPDEYRSMFASSVRPYLASLLVLTTYWPLSPLPYHYDLGSSPTIPTDYAQLDLDLTSPHFLSPHSLLLLTSTTPGLTSSSCSPTGHSSSHWNLWTCHPALVHSPAILGTRSVPRTKSGTPAAPRIDLSLRVLTTTSSDLGPTRFGLLSHCFASHCLGYAAIQESSIPEPTRANPSRPDLIGYRLCHRPISLHLALHRLRFASPRVASCMLHYT
ncbi:hypothetical protein B0H16DRAFT_1796273 [Mycena metata]|uniref:Uncharacterized protein n=1 Tax=Mycena metata TaxID=1033252 RepID=A0AAD7MII9_9AGAR|nr:hypothetical protein B0H16DRAFT_1796273 [Mycena metata]